MALTVNSNIQALNAYRNLSKTQATLSNSLEKLSSGLRINRAADDAAGLAISEGLKAQIGGVQQASKNAQDGISLVQTADGALSQSQAILQRLRTLAVQSANGSQSTDSRSAINAEADALKSELTRIAQTSSFNGVNLLDGTYQAGKNFQIGYKQDSGVSVQGNVIAVSIDSGATLTSAVVGSAATHATYNGSSSSNLLASYGAGNTLTVSVKVDGVALTYTYAASTTGGTSDTEGTNIAAALSAQNSGAVTFTYNTTSDAFSVTSNTSTTGAADSLQILSVATTAAGVLTGLAASTTTGVNAVLSAATVTAGSFDVSGLHLADLDLSNQASATAAITAVDTAITNVSKARASLGALQNRFQYTVDNLDTTAENLSAAQSRITDTDMAQEMVSFTRSQILAQAGTSMLSQAKNLPSSILDLLRG